MSRNFENFENYKNLNKIMILILINFAIINYILYSIIQIEKEVILKEINKENIIINLEELKEKLKIFIKTEKRIVEIEVEPN